MALPKSDNKIMLMISSGAGMTSSEEASVEALAEASEACLAAFSEEAPLETLVISVEVVASHSNLPVFLRWAVQVPHQRRLKLL